MKLQPVPKREYLPVFDRYEPVVQDHSAIKLYKTCGMKYFFRIVLGYTAKKTALETVFSWGTAYHKYREVLEIEYAQSKNKDLSHQKATLAAISIFKPAQIGATGKWAHLTLVNFLKMLGVAYEWWKAEKQQGAIKVLATEQPFNLEMPEGYLIGGRFDQIITWNGRLWIRDFKTTSKKKEYFVKSLNPNDQATRYIYGATKLQGQRIDGIFYEILYTSNEGKKEQKVVKSQMYTYTPGKTPGQLDQWEKDQDEYNRRLIYSRENDIWPMNEDACNFCDYHDVCTKSSDQAKINILKTNYLLKPWDHENVDQKAIDPEEG